MFNDYILSIIPKGAKVLDLGCGNGDLLERLRQEKHVQGYGIDIDFNHILACTKRCISVFHWDINEGLPEFSAQSFDYVILSQTLQQVKIPPFILSEMLRIGQKGIVTFPNFGHWKIRLQLLLRGQAPHGVGHDREGVVRDTPDARHALGGEDKGLRADHGRWNP